jgi:Zn-dependent protease with chaperone function
VAEVPAAVYVPPPAYPAAAQPQHPPVAIPAQQPHPYPPPVPTVPPVPGTAAQDDLHLATGRKHLKAYQRGVDGAALSQLVVALPTAVISLFVVVFVGALVNPLLGMVLPVLWLLSGPLVFHRTVEGAIARHLLGMRRATPAEAERLGAVWEEVTRRAGVDRLTYELWIQERAELNATAVAGHIVGVTRHAMDRLPNSRLAAVLAHELGHHVGGHTWAGMLVDWYALPARTAGRWIIAGLSFLFRSKNWAGIACGGCLSVTILQFLFFFTFMEGMWWLVLPVAAGPVLIAWLHRRAEFGADAYASGLGFGDELMEVLAEEHRARSMPGPFPQGMAPYGAPPHTPYAPPGPYVPTPEPARTKADRVMSKGAHTNFEARLSHLRRAKADRNPRPGS